MITLKKSVLTWKMNEKDCKVQRGLPINIVVSDNYFVEKGYVLIFHISKLYSTN